MADDVCESLRLDRVLFVPAAQPPHKPPTELAPASHRFQMTALAVREHPRFEVSDVEVKRSGMSYTVDTLTALRERGRLHLIIGSETFLDLLSWRDPQRVARLTRLVVIPRAESAFDPDGIQPQKVLAEIGQERWIRVPPPLAAAEPAGKGVLLVAATSLPISSSDLRRRARAGRSLTYRMPEAVRAYVLEHRLYRDEG